MTESPAERVPTPEERAADLTKRIAEVEANLAEATRETDSDEPVSLAVSDAQAILSELRRALLDLRVQHPMLAPAADDRDIVVPNPDEPLGPPIYEGESARAHDYLVPGLHRATAADDEDPAIYTLHVLDTESRLYLRADSQIEEWGNAEASRAQAQTQADVSAMPAGTATRSAGDGSPRAGMRISIAGNVAAEPTFGLTQDGRSWARLRVASHERVRDAAGQWTSTPPSYTEVVLFGRTAEDAANTLQIGDPVLVQGRPEVQAFTRRDGAPRAGLKVFATTVTRRDTEPATLVQGPATRADRPADRRVGEQDTAGHPTGPVIHHTQAHTIAVGVTREDKDVQAALKSAGFRWSGPRAAWYLPATMDHHQRSLRVDTASRGGAMAVTDSPAPNVAGAPAPASTATHDAPSASTGPAAPHADLSPDL